MSLPDKCGLALKEWAVTQRALDRGEQVLLLRKGGIREDDKDFRVLHPEFLLYPTYEHQRADLLKPAYQQELRLVLSQPHSPDEIVFSHWARVELVIEVTRQRQVEALSPHYLWNTTYAEARLHWKPRTPLLVLLVRVYRLEAPQKLSFRSEYAGCKSWVRLERDVTLGALTPVLSDADFQTRAEQVRAASEADGA